MAAATRLLLIGVYLPLYPFCVVHYMLLPSKQYYILQCETLYFKRIKTTDWDQKDKDDHSLLSGGLHHMLYLTHPVIWVRGGIGPKLSSGRPATV